MSRFYNLISRSRYVLLAAAYALLVLLMCYMLGNTTFSLGEDKVIAQRLHAMKSVLTKSEAFTYYNLFPVNVAYDRELVDWEDEYGIPVGKMPVTDRASLLRFLQIAKETDYRYVMLDVFFEEGITTPVDSALFSLIADMDNIVIPAHRDTKAADEILYSRQAFADYSTSIFDGDFGKYRYIYDDSCSMAWKMYADLTGAEFTQWGPFAFCNGRLCRKCLFPDFRVNPAGNAYTSGGDKVYYNLGADLLESTEDIDFSVLLKDKCILIGDFTESDMHNTYVGDMSGAYINYNAFLSLKSGKHYVSFWPMFLLYLVYFMISYMLIKHTSVFQLIPFLRKVKSPVWRFIFSWFGFSIVLSIFSTAVYLIEGNIYDILAVSCCFSILSTCLEFYQTLKSKSL